MHQPWTNQLSVLDTAVSLLFKPSLIHLKPPTPGGVLHWLTDRVLPFRGQIEEKCGLPNRFENFAWIYYQMGLVYKAAGGA